MRIFTQTMCVRVYMGAGRWVFLLSPRSQCFLAAVQTQSLINWKKHACLHVLCEGRIKNCNYVEYIFTQLWTGLYFCFFSSKYPCFGTMLDLQKFGFAVLENIWWGNPQFFFIIFFWQCMHYIRGDLFVKSDPGIKPVFIILKDCILPGEVTFWRTKKVASGQESSLRRGFLWVRVWPRNSFMIKSGSDTLKNSPLQLTMMYCTV